MKESPYPQCFHPIMEQFAVGCQGIQKMSDLHQVVITFHGLPCIGVGMFVMVSLMLFLENTILNFPAVSAHFRAAIENIAPFQRSGKKPRVSRLAVFRFSRAAAMYFRPCFVTNDHIEFQKAKDSMAVPIPVLDTVGPEIVLYVASLLSRATPLYPQVVFLFQQHKPQRIFPYGRHCLGLQVDHKSPMILVTDLKNGSAGIQSVHYYGNRCISKAPFDLRR